MNHGAAGMPPAACLASRRMLSWISEIAQGIPALISVGDPETLVASLGYLAVFLLVMGDGDVGGAIETLTRHGRWGHPHLPR